MVCAPAQWKLATASLKSDGRYSATIFSGSSLITITALAIPDAKVEIQGYAVIDSK